MKKLLLFGALAFGLNAFGQTNNYSLEFDGVDDFVELPTNGASSFSATDSFSILLWVKVTGNTSCQALAVRADQNGEWDYGLWKGIPWQKAIVNLESSIGDTIRLIVTAADCGYGGHGGYVYLDSIE